MRQMIVLVCCFLVLALFAEAADAQIRSRRRGGDGNVNILARRGASVSVAQGGGFGGAQAFANGYGGVQANAFRVQRQKAFVQRQKVLVQQVPVYQQQVLVQQVPVYQQRVLVQQAPVCVQSFSAGCGGGAAAFAY